MAIELRTQQINTAGSCQYFPLIHRNFCSYYFLDLTV